MASLAIMLGPKGSEGGEADPGAKDEVIADLKDAGLKVDDYDLFLEAIRRWSQYCEEGDDMGETESEPGEEGGGMAAKLRK